MNSTDRLHRFHYRWRQVAGVLIALLWTCPAYSQKNITVHLKARPLSELIKIVEKETDYKFFYEEQKIDTGRPVTIDVERKSIDEVLSQAFRELPFTYTIREKRILLHPKRETDGPITERREISGVVKDESGEPLIGVTVRVKNTSLGTASSADGRFTLNVPAGPQVLIFSYIGYQTREMKVGQTRSITIELKEAVQEMDDVVVIGYGTLKKRDLTGAISSLKAKDLDIAGVPSVAHSLAGKAAGLYVRQNSAQPGGGLDILIRGAGSINASNDPLYIVDGFPISKLDQLDSGNGKMVAGTQGVLNFLNPHDVESIEVLKDASATSIYGSRAANGVVIITTKRGKEGKPQIDYSASYSFQHYTDTYDVLSLPEWMEERNTSTWEKWRYNNQVYPWGDRTLEEALASPANGLKYTRPFTDRQIAEAGPGTDWVKLVTRDGYIQQHNVSLHGGSEFNRYLVSFNYYDHQGIVKNSGLTRYTLKANLDQKINRFVHTGLSLTLSRVKNDNTQLGSARFENSGIIRSAVQMNPSVAAYDPETNTYPINPLLGTQPNPYSLLNNEDKGLTDRFLGNVFIEAFPFDGLKLRFNAGIDRALQSRKTYQPKSTLNGGNLGGVATINKADHNQYLLEVTANYAKTFAREHQINALAGFSYEQFDDETESLGNNNFLTDGFTYNNLGAGSGTKIVGSGYTQNKMMSYFFRINYTWRNRYILGATLRADGASVFARDHKWGYFPSVSAGWTLSEERFLEGASSWLSNLKIRASYGQTGNATINTNAFASYSASHAYDKEDGSKEIGVFLNRLENPDLKWETTSEYNVGIDFGFLNQRISGSLEFYHKVVSDLLNYKPLNSYQEITRVIANVGKTQSTGLELTINTHNIERKHFSWSTDFTFTRYKDRWKERTPDWKPSVYERYDAPIRAIYSRRSDGIMQIGDPVPECQPDLRPGGIYIRDINGYVRDENGDPMVNDVGRFVLTGAPDGIIDDADTELLGTSDPGWLAGLTNTFRYKDFDLSFHLNGMFDRFMQNKTYIDYGLSAEGISDYGYNALRVVRERWSPENPSTDRPSSFGGGIYGHGDMLYEKAWFIRLQDLVVGYSLPRRWLERTKVLSKVRFYVNINNVFLITPYSGLDPETDSYSSAYPNARTYSLGVDISF